MADDEAFSVRDRRRRDEGDQEPSASAPSSPAPPLPGPEGGPDLQGLFIMLASSALVSLGDAAHPETGERTLDLEQAKEAIDLLSLLRAKTEGNRTEQEGHLLEEMLYDLQMRFVRATTGAGAGG